MFDPVASVSQTNDVLNNEQKLFVKKYFSKVIADDILAASVLEDCPVPDEPILLLKTLDHDVVDLMQNNTAKHVKKQDAGYQFIGRRIRFALGPIFQLWKMLVKARKEKCSDTVDCNKLVRYVEQSVVCLGQASQTVDHQRRMVVLTRIIPKPKKCLEILVRNDDVLKKNKELFGASFYTALHRHAKGNRQLREAKRKLQGHSDSAMAKGKATGGPFMALTSPVQGCPISMS